MQHEDNLELPLNKHQQAKTNTYLHMIYTLDKRLCVKTQNTLRWFPATIKALCPEPRSYQIETPEGVTYREHRTI